jgi:hypothetical protein
MPAGEFAFRRANDSLHRTFVRKDGFESYPFLCECPDGRCTELFLISLSEYEHVRRHPQRFIVVTGHDERFDDVQVVGTEDGFAVVERIAMSDRPPLPEHVA